MVDLGIVILIDSDASARCSDFLPVPGTNDCHFFVLRTEETLDNVISSYGSVVDLDGSVLMEEQIVSQGGKFEGCEIIDAFLAT